MWKKDDVYYALRQVRQRHPQISFGDAPPAELGYVWEVPPVPAPTPEQIQQRLTFAVQIHLDAKARERGYDSLLSATSYVDDPNPVFAAEGVAFKAWRSAVWTYCYAVLADVQAETRPIPTEAELLAELPQYTAP